jgi:catechol 2,3-dioxygenase-like lactoylglutathione lyase family enzyme
VISRVVLLSLLCVAMLAAQTEGSVVGVGPFLHIVSDLDQSLAFYHDKLGLELSGPAGEHKFTDNPAVANLYGVPGKQFRAAVLKIPGSEMGIELVQWGEAALLKEAPHSGPGTVTLILRRSGSGQSLHDPDGFPVEVIQAESPGASLSVAVRDVDRATALFAGTLGLSADRVRFAKADGPGITAAFPTPGEGMLRLFVNNVAALTASLKAAGFSVITTGGAPVTLPQGPRVIILRDPNSFYLQLMQMK